MIQLAWRFLLFQKDSALAQWYRTRTAGAGKNRKTMIVALARKLLIALWRLVTTGEVPAGVVSHSLSDGGSKKLVSRSNSRKLLIDGHPGSESIAPAYPAPRIIR
jgi:hypothetical protein